MNHSDNSGFLRRFGESAVLVRQATGKPNDYGEWVPGRESGTPLSVVSAPPSAGTLRNVMPEGDRLQDWRTFWIEGAAEPVRVGAAPTEGDVIEYHEIRYRIRQVEDWWPHGFVEVLGVREEGQDSQ